jgi:hypothetical protein
VFPINGNNYILFYFTNSMKITIDTKEDSHDDIQKVIEILKHFQNNTPEPTDTTNMMSMFGSEPETPVPTTQESTTQTTATPQASIGTPPDFTSFLNIANKEEPKEDKGIQFF